MSTPLPGLLPWYCTREQVKAALDVAETSYVDDQIDRLCASSSRQIDRDTGNVFFPFLGTRTFDYPDVDAGGSGWRLWFDGPMGLIRLDSLVVGDATPAPGDYLLRPDSGPPFRYLETRIGVSPSFLGGGSSWQRSVSITGLWGWRDDLDLAGTLSGSISSSATTITCSNSRLIGVGDLVGLGLAGGAGERVIVTDKGYADTGITLITTALQADAGQTVLTLSAGTVARGETILLDGEAMAVVVAAGSTVVVKRAVEGTVLAPHSIGAHVFAPRQLTVVRGACGTTAVAHNGGDALSRTLVPGPVSTWAVAATLVTLQGERAGYGSGTTKGSDTSRSSTAADYASARDRVMNTSYNHNRMRVRAI